MAPKKSKAKSKVKTKAKTAKASASRTKKTKVKKAKKAARPVKASPAKAKKGKKTVKAKRPVKAAKKTVKKKKQIVGEGDYQASRKFDKDQSAFVKRNEAAIPALGKAAEQALDGPEGDALREAEASAADRSRDRF